MKTQISANPAKAFFVEMLTRDISLEDAILDLIDNAMDGIQRQPKLPLTYPYNGFEIHITLSKSKFVIWDNCGGISRDTAVNTAFRLGRPKTMLREKVPTMGVYGIGMKRAIFKLGRKSEIFSSTDTDHFRVLISKEWMSDDDAWELPLEDLAVKEMPTQLKQKHGTLIEVTDLTESVSTAFAHDQSPFIDDFPALISSHFSYAIQNGLKIVVNKKPVIAKIVTVLISKGDTPRIEPFVFRQKLGEVDISVMVGLYTKILSEEEVEKELEGRASTANRDSCGWTIMCNDRIVVFNDKTRLTGWGEASVPAYHSQFNAISGIVRFQSKNTALLPLTTTKRGLDSGSDLYLSTKDVMREGLKLFTDFTNRWKNDSPARNKMLGDSDRVESLAAMARYEKQSKPVKTGRFTGAKKYTPSLPRPASNSARDSEQVIKFSRSTNDIRFLADCWGDEDLSPSDVGGKCFDIALKRAKK